MDVEDWVWIPRFHNFGYRRRHFKTESQEAICNEEIKEKQIIIFFNITR
jgi:hypothetical protein